MYMIRKNTREDEVENLQKDYKDLLDKIQGEEKLEKELKDAKNKEEYEANLKKEIEDKQQKEKEAKLLEEKEELKRKQEAQTKRKNYTKTELRQKSKILKLRMLGLNVDEEGVYSIDTIDDLLKSPKEYVIPEGVKKLKTTYINAEVENDMKIRYPESITEGGITLGGILEPFETLLIKVPKGKEEEVITERALSREEKKIELELQKDTILDLSKILEEGNQSEDISWKILMLNRLSLKTKGLKIRAGEEIKDLKSIGVSEEILHESKKIKESEPSNYEISIRRLIEEEDCKEESKTSKLILYIEDESQDYILKLKEVKK